MLKKGVARVGLYVGTRIRTDLELLWHRTQDPAQHQRWDLRFTEISWLPKDDPAEPQHFRYATRVLPGLTLSGVGTAAGERHLADGSRTSALRFRSPHPLSPLAHGSGYWRYVPDGDALRFFTGYDYAPRWGRAGEVADRLCFRPLMGWATAWSFDRLRLWCERGVTPERALANAAAETALRAGAAWCALMFGGPLVALLAVLAVLLAPPLPHTPSARRCVRRAPRVRGEAQPRLLSRLEQP